MKSSPIGYWRIVAMEQWDQEFIDLIAHRPAGGCESMGFSLPVLCTPLESLALAACLATA